MSNFAHPRYDISYNCLCRGNSGGVGAAKFISKLIISAPELVKIDASYNVLPAEAVSIISSSLETAKGTHSVIP